MKKVRYREAFKLSCGDCRFFNSAYKEYEHDGECRRRSPNAEHGFPKVHKVGWCGDHLEDAWTVEDDKVDALGINVGSKVQINDEHEDTGMLGIVIAIDDNLEEASVEFENHVKLMNYEHLDVVI